MTCTPDRSVRTVTALGLLPVPTARVIAAGGIVHINDPASADPDLLRLVQRVGDPEAVVQLALSTGTRALAVAQTSVDTRLVEDSFARLLKACGTRSPEPASRYRLPPAIC